MDGGMFVTGGGMFVMDGGKFVTYIYTFPYVFKGRGMTVTEYFITETVLGGHIY